MKKLIVFGLLSGFLLFACRGMYVPSDKYTGYPEELIPADGPVNWGADVVAFEQGWDDDVRSDFWFTSQGSQILPYTWFTWLEQPTNNKLIRQTDHMEELGYIPVESSRYNPSGLPIGFAITRSKSMKDAFLGFTCAACHTHMIEHEDKTFLIDGAPTLADFVGFYDEIVDALDVTYRDDAKFERFARNVLKNKYTVSSAGNLREELLTYAVANAERREVNALPAHYPEDFTSYGRLDAFTNIENAGTAFALDMLDNRNPAIAPVSYPFLWGSHQSDVVQWNGSAPNKPRAVGPLVRNAGEVVGVFGGLKIKPRKERFLGRKHKYTSTLDFEGLGRLEGMVAKLKAPAWNDANSNLPAVDLDAVARGMVHFQTYCQACHEVIDSTDQYDFYNAKMIGLDTLGTDPLMAWAAAHHRASTGSLAGEKAQILIGEVMGDSATSITIPVNGVVGLVLESPLDALNGVNFDAIKKPKATHKITVDNYADARDAILEAKAAEHKEDAWVEKDGELVRNLDGLEYKARPLNGIWATGPFLHNGSVPNLWELMKSPDQRAEKFWVGSRKFDPVNVGFVTNEGKNEFRVKHQGKIMPGNSNRGHAYGTAELSDTEKRDLIEYLKTL